jgi:drug/metabolite transporter (DMT)-like permease
MITKTHSRRQSGVLIGYFAALTASVAYGGGQTIARGVMTELASPLVAAAIALAFGFLYVSVAFHRSIIRDLRVPNPSLVWFGLSGLASAWGVTFLFFGMSHAPVVVVAPMAAANPLITLLLARFLLRSLEPITRRVTMGVLLVVLGVCLVAFGNALS